MSSPVHITNRAVSIYYFDCSRERSHFLCFDSVLFVLLLFDRGFPQAFPYEPSEPPRLIRRNNQLCALTVAGERVYCCCPNSDRSAISAEAQMEVLVKAFGAVALLLTVSAGGSAQPTAAVDSCADTAVQVASPQPPACFDGTPHKEICVPVDKGVKLQVLDWGGADKPDTMVLLTGYGDNAHVYDEFAYQFTDYFHVIGITRRGFLPSSQPESGYDVDTRAHDDIEVLKYFGISKAIFVGHSLAGSELSKLGLKYKSYVEKLVYLDAFDLAKRFKLPAIPDPPYIEGRDEVFADFSSRP